MRNIRFVFCTILLLCLSMAGLPARADGGVPPEAMRARGSVYRVEWSDDEWIYSGSGFVLFANARYTLLATNYHVVAGAPAAAIHVLTHEGEDVPAAVVCYDENTDLCVLRTRRSLAGAAALPLTDAAAPESGAAVYAFGFPAAGDYFLDDFGYSAEDVTVTDGIISAVKSTAGFEAGGRITLIQMSAAINPGSSGGPLTDARGYVLGVNTFNITDAQDVYGAVSVAHLIALLDNNGIEYIGAAAQTTPAANTQPAAQTEPAAEAKPSMVPAPSLPPVVLFWGLGGGLVLAAFALLWILRRHGRITLEQFMRNRGQGLPPEQALFYLRPVFQSLQALHLRGRAHLGVSPRTIFIDRRRGTLILSPSRRRTDPADRPYRAPEHYDGGTGAFTDIYALGGVLYYMLTANAPDDVLTRLACDGLPERLTGLEGLSDDLRASLLQAMALRRELRCPDMTEFSRALGLYALPSPVQGPAIALALSPEVRQRQKWTARQRTAAWAVSSVILLCTVFAVGWGYHEYRYSRSLALLEKGQYHAAYGELCQAFIFYRDAEQLGRYIVARAYLENREYDEAKERFQTLQNYKDAAEFYYACDYAKAAAYLQDDALDPAKELFKTLAAVPYKDAQDMVWECDYRTAINYLDAQAYDAANELFTALAQYKDAADMALESQYQKADALYLRREYKSAEKIYGVLAEASYKDAGEMVKDCKYNQAILAYDSNRFNEAKTLFADLAESAYKDSASMVNEVDIKRAELAFDGEKYKEAIGILDSISNYVRADEILWDMKYDIYNIALYSFELNADLYNINDFSEALELFQLSAPIGYSYEFQSLIYGIQYDMDYMPSLINTNPNDPSIIPWIIYKNLLTYWEYPPLQDIILNNTYVNYFLQGEWRGDGYYFKMSDSKDQNFRTNYNLPSYEGEYYIINDLVYSLGSYEKGYTKTFILTPVNENCIDFYVYKTGKTHRLYRQ